MKTERLPLIYRLILRFLILRDDFEQFCGDLEESYLIEINKSGKFKAHRFILFQIIKSVPGLIISSIVWGSTMLKSYLKMAFRNIFKNKLYSGINITGFAVGLAAAILTFLFVINELRVNQNFKDLDQLYQIQVNAHLNGNIQVWGGCPPAAETYIEDNFPEILESSILVSKNENWLVRYNDKKFFEDIRLGEFSYFKVFSHNILSGEIPENDEINYVMIDKETADKFFKDENPVGKTLTFDEKFDFTVAAVFETMSATTNEFKILVPFKIIDKVWYPGTTKNWGNYIFKVFVKTQKNLDVNSFNQKIEKVIVNNRKEAYTYPFLYPFKDKYLYEYNSIKNVKIYGVITFFLLLIASVNYINLSSAQSIKRAKEVGIRKIVGARKKQIVTQFFFESLLITLSGAVFAGILVYFFFPAWKDFNNLTISLIEVISEVKIISGIVLVIILTAVLSCFYPAFIVASFLPKKVLSGNFATSQSGKKFRSGLTLIQFAISVILVIITLSISKQIDFMKNKHPGVDKEQTFYIRLKGEKQYKNKFLLRDEIAKIPGVKSASLSSHLPGSGNYWNTSAFGWNGKSENYKPLICENAVDENYIKTYGIKLLEGREIKNSGKSRNRVYINETLAKMIAKENLIGSKISYAGSRSYEIVGIISDFHHSTLRENIEPFVFYTDPIRMYYEFISVKFETARVSEILNEAEKIVATVDSAFPFDYGFIDEIFGKRYLSEEKLQFTIQIFGIIAIFISCLGLLGMSSYIVNIKRKEIGVRKVLGAGVSKILIMFLKDFTKWVLLSNIIAWPIAYFYIEKWLSDYAFRIDIPYEIFVYSGITAFVLAVITVSGQVIKAANADPVMSLRTE